MEKSFNKHKIIIMLIAIITAILTFSIAIFGVSINTERKEKGESANVAMQIRTPADLQSFSEKVNGGTSFLGQTVELSNNINCSSLTNFVPIGTADNPFQGTFEGNECTISNLSIYIPHDNEYSDGEYQKEYTYGLFGHVSGVTINNLRMNNCSIATAQLHNKNSDLIINAGLLVGRSKGMHNGTNIVSINNCVINGTIIFATQYERLHDIRYGIGGVVGFVRNDTKEIYINNVASQVDISATSSWGEIWVGGIVAVFESVLHNYSDDRLSKQHASNKISITNSYYSGTVSIPKGNFDYSSAAAHIVVGGILGEITTSYRNIDSYILDNYGRRTSGQVYNVKLIIKNCFANFDGLTLWTWGASGAGPARFFSVYYISSACTIPEAGLDNDVILYSSYNNITGYKASGVLYAYLLPKNEYEISNNKYSLRGGISCNREYWTDYYHPSNKEEISVVGADGSIDLW